MNLFLIIYSAIAFVLTCISWPSIDDYFRNVSDKILMTLFVFFVSPLWGIFYILAAVKEKLNASSHKS